MAAIKIRIPKGHHLMPSKVGASVAMPAMSGNCTGMDDDGADVESTVPMPKAAAKEKKMSPRDYLLRKK